MVTENLLLSSKAALNSEKNFAKKAENVIVNDVEILSAHLYDSATEKNFIKSTRPENEFEVVTPITAEVMTGLSIGKTSENKSFNSLLSLNEIVSKENVHSTINNKPSTEIDTTNETKSLFHEIPTKYATTTESISVKLETMSNNATAILTSTKAELSKTTITIINATTIINTTNEQLHNTLKSTEIFGYKNFSNLEENIPASSQSVNSTYLADEIIKAIKEYSDSFVGSFNLEKANRLSNKINSFFASQDVKGSLVERSQLAEHENKNQTENDSYKGFNPFIRFIEVCSGVLQSPWFCEFEYYATNPRCKFIYSLEWNYEHESGFLELEIRYKQNQLYRPSIKRINRDIFAVGFVDIKSPIKSKWFSINESKPLIADFLYWNERNPFTNIVIYSSNHIRISQIVQYEKVKCSGIGFLILGQTTSENSTFRINGNNDEDDGKSHENRQKIENDDDDDDDDDNDKKRSVYRKVSYRPTQIELVRIASKTEVCPGGCSLCHQIPNFGSFCLRSPKIRWYFNTMYRQCVQFVYYGCYGNNFDTKESCNSKCLNKNESEFDSTRVKRITSADEMLERLPNDLNSIKTISDKVSNFITTIFEEMRQPFESLKNFASSTANKMTNRVESFVDKNNLTIINLGKKLFDGANQTSLFIFSKIEPKVQKLAGSNPDSSILLNDKLVAKIDNKIVFMNDTNSNEEDN
jgi:hypothetical protein